MADNYEKLRESFDNAADQASQGKGKQRHACDNAFEDQLMCSAQRLLKDHPCGGLAYQVIKKTVESGRILKLYGVESARKELWGAMNYLAGMDIIYQEQEDTSKEELDLEEGVKDFLSYRDN